MGAFLDILCTLLQGLIIKKLIKKGSIAEYLTPIQVNPKSRSYFAILESVVNLVNEKNQILLQQREKIEILLVKYFKEVGDRDDDNEDNNDNDGSGLRQETYRRPDNNNIYEEILLEVNSEDLIAFTQYQDVPSEKKELVPTYISALILQELGFSTADFDPVILDVIREIAGTLTFKSLTYGALCAKKRNRDEIA